MASPNSTTIGTILFIVVIALLAWAIINSYRRSKLKAIPVVQSVDVNRYMGTWYEVARLPTVFQQGCSDSMAQYSLNSDQSIRITNTCNKNGSSTQISGRAVPNDASITNGILSPGRLKVSFGSPFDSEYNILDLTSDYSMAMVSGSINDKKNLWILSRNRIGNPNVISQMISHAESLGFNTKGLIYS